MSLPAPVPGHRARTDLRTVIIAVIVGALTLGGVVVGGRLIAGGVNYAQPPATGDYFLNVWLLPSQHPNCQCSQTAFGQLSIYLGTLADGPGSFPLGYGP